MKLYLIKRRDCKISPLNLEGLFGEAKKDGFWVKGCRAFFRKKYAQGYIDEAYGENKNLVEIISVELKNEK